MSTATGEVLALPCRSWKCSRCSVTNRRAFSKRVRIGLSQPDRERPKFLTLTSVPGEAPWQSRQRLARRFAELRRRLERAFPGCRVEYAGTVELTRAGAVHFHVLLRGVPFMPAGPGSPWSRLAQACGFGRVVQPLAVRKRAGRGLGAYLGKDLGQYLTKAASSTAWPPHFRRVRFSQAWAPGWVPRARSGRQPGAEPSAWRLHRVVPLGAAESGWRGGAGQGRPEGGGAAADP